MYYYVDRVKKEYVKTKTRIKSNKNELIIVNGSKKELYIERVLDMEGIKNV